MRFDTESNQLQSIIRRVCIENLSSVLTRLRCVRSDGAWGLRCRLADSWESALYTLCDMDEVRIHYVISYVDTTGG